jgi:hypothetical protein
MLRVVQVTGSRSVASAPGTVVVTAADTVAGHVWLDISCLDRLYLTGFVAKLQTAGGVIYFFHDHRASRSRPRRCPSRQHLGGDPGEVAQVSLIQYRQPNRASPDLSESSEAAQQPRHAPSICRRPR